MTDKKVTLATHGGPGRGGGRKLKSGAKAVRKTVTLDPADLRTLLGLGNGGLSEGIRKAVELARKSIESGNALENID